MRLMQGFPWKNGEKPYFTNKEGFDWYIQEDLTEYCKEKGLLNVVVFLVAKGEKPETYAVVEKGRLLHTNQQYEGVLCWIDCISFVMRNPD